jgi:anti-sigma-K factor RskA
MLSDDERISLVVGDNADAAARAEAALLVAALADPATWAEPPPALEEAVAAQIRDEASLGRASVPSRAAGRPARAHSRNRWLIPLVGVAAAGIVAVGVGLAVRDEEDESPVALASLEASELEPDATGSVEVFESQAGFRVVLDATGLPRQPNDGFYEAWVRGEDGTLVSLGTFSESAGPITLWSGVDPRQFGSVTITRELPDGNPDSSGDRVLGGPLVEP